MDGTLRFNNNLIFLKSITTLIIPFFLGIENVGDIEAHFEELSSFYSKDFNVHQA
jgi:hypothetical protein